MTREERSEGLAAAARTRRGELIALADRVLEERACDVVRAPAAGSVLLEVESEIGAFYASEVVMTTAAVRLDRIEGYGCVLGFDREAALASAVLDADASSAVMRLVESALAAERAERERRAAAVIRTKV